VSTYNELARAYRQLDNAQERDLWIARNMTESLAAVSESNRGRNVILYGSAFLQQQNAPASHANITLEDVNGFMAVVRGMDCDRGLTLIMHTPGGVAPAAQSVVAYLRSKFEDIDIIVPAAAMSAGTMISLAGSEIILGRHSQLGPIDPQMPTRGGRAISARAVVDQFEAARADLIAGGDARLWGPILQSQGPSLLEEAKNAVLYSRELVADWLRTYMFADDEDRDAKAARIADFFGDVSRHRVHGRPIGYDEAAREGLKVRRLEDNQNLQETVLTAYHLMTLAFENTFLMKVIWSSSGGAWIKQWTGAADATNVQQVAARQGDVAAASASN